MSYWGFLAGAIFFNVAGNILLKKFALTLPDSGLLAYFNLLFIGGAALFGINLLLYARAVQVIPLSIAYPVLVGVSVLLVACASVYFFSERISVMTAIGIATTIVGLVLITRGAST